MYCLHWFLYALIFFNQCRAGGSRADGGRTERANFEDTNADRTVRTPGLNMPMTPAKTI